jgi:hypothetical protein
VRNIAAITDESATRFFSFIICGVRYEVCGVRCEV